MKNLRSFNTIAVYVEEAIKDFNSQVGKLLAKESDLVSVSVLPATSPATITNPKGSKPKNAPYEVVFVYWSEEQD